VPRYHSDPEETEGTEGIRNNVSIAVSGSVFNMSSFRTQRLNLEVTELLSFEGDEELLRGIPFGEVLRNCGRILRHSDGSDDTYHLSRKVAKISMFLSHNWVVPRWKKFVALTFHMNFNIAAVLWCSLFLLPFLLIALSPFRLMDSPAWREGFGQTVRIGGIPCLLLLLVFVRSIPGFRRISDPSVFLDKACIPQHDQILQRRGIRKLGAFLAKSESMVVLYSDTYLLRLWTVYEVASFLSLHSLDKIKIVPVSKPLVIIAGMMAFWASALLQVAAPFVLDQRIIGMDYFVLMVAFVPYLRVTRGWARNRATIKKRLESFEVQECDCLVASDRSLVYGNIARLMKAAGRVGIDSEEEEALDAFNRLVRQKLPKAFFRGRQSLAFEYKHYVVAAAAEVIPKVIQLFFKIRDSMHPQLTAAILIEQLALVFTFWPLVFMLIEVLSACFLQRRGCCEWLWLAVAEFGIIGPLGVAVHYSIHKLTFAGFKDFLPLGVLACVALAGFGVQRLASPNSACCSRRKRRSGQPDSSTEALPDLENQTPQCSLSDDNDNTIDIDGSLDCKLDNSEAMTSGETQLGIKTDTDQSAGWESP